MRADTTLSIHELGKTAKGRQSEYVFELIRGDQLTQVKVRRKPRKSMALYVEKGVMTELRVPVNCAWLHIHSFLESRFEWILSAAEALRNQASRPQDNFAQGGEVSFLGERYPLDLVTSRYGVVEIDDGRLYLSCSDPDNNRLVEKQVLNWFRRQAEIIFAERIEQLKTTFPMSTNPSGLRVRKMKARWGSCSSRGEICLNLMLIRESLSYIDFVIAHELCHLHHFAHNRAFYGLLDEVMPDWRVREQHLLATD